MAVQTRGISVVNGFDGYACFSTGFVLVAHGPGRALHTPLPDDERVIRDHSGSICKWLLLPGLCSEADTGFNASGSK